MSVNTPGRLHGDSVEPGRFRTDWPGDSSRVFVYGREVQDFRVVDYEAIAMLNVSATQALHRRMARQAAAAAAETAALRDEVAQLRALLSTALEAARARQ